MNRLILATELYPPDIGGPATYTKLLHDELPGRGFEVTVLSFGKVRHLPKGIRHLVYAWRLYWLAKRHDLIYAQDPISVGLPTYLASLLARKPYLLKVVGDYAWEQGSQRFGVTDPLDLFVYRSAYALPVKILKFLERYVANHAEEIIVPSHYLKSIISAWGVPPAKITVIYNAFTIPKAVTSGQMEARQALGVTGKILLSVGRLVPWKGFSLLIEVMAALQARYPDVMLYIAGSGPEEARLQKLINDQHLVNRVVLLGQLPRGQLSQWVEAADVFLLNTSYEGFSHQLLEVMAAGTPIITTAVGGNVELLKDGTTGLLVEYNHHVEWVRAIERLLESPALGKSLAAHARIKVTEFTKESMLNKLTPVLV